MAATTIFQCGAISVSDYRCSAGPGDRPFAEAHRCHSISYVRKADRRPDNLVYPFYLK